MSKAKGSPDDLLSVRQAAVELGCSAGRVHALMRTGRLKANRLDHFWFIRRADLDPVRVRPPGRPRKEPSDDKTTEKKKTMTKKKSTRGG